jgi:hypothetical protein
MANDLVPFFDEADQITGTATAAVIGKRFVRITGDLQADGTVSIGPPAAGGRVFGIAEQDAAIGRRVGVIRERGQLVPATTGAASGAMAAFAEVQVDATGAIIPLAAGVAVGYIVTGTAGNGADAMLSLY